MTGVQTCALPIYKKSSGRSVSSSEPTRHRVAWIRRPNSNGRNPLSEPKSSPAGKKRDAVVAQSKVSAGPHACPVCGHTHVVLEGKWQRHFQKEFVDGVEVGVAVQEETYVERYIAIVCDKCNTRTGIEPDHVVDLLADNVRLQMISAGRRGITVVNGPESKVN